MSSTRRVTRADTPFPLHSKFACAPLPSTLQRALLPIVTELTVCWLEHQHFDASILGGVSLAGALHDKSLVPKPAALATPPPAPTGSTAPVAPAPEAAAPPPTDSPSKSATSETPAAAVTSTSEALTPADAVALARSYRLLNLCSDWLSSYLSHALTKIDRVTFGIMTVGVVRPERRATGGAQWDRRGEGLMGLGACPGAFLTKPCQYARDFLWGKLWKEECVCWCTKPQGPRDAGRRGQRNTWSALRLRRSYKNRDSETSLSCIWPPQHFCSAPVPPSCLMPRSVLCPTGRRPAPRARARPLHACIALAAGHSLRREGRP